MAVPAYIRIPEDPEGWEAPEPTEGETAREFMSRVNRSRNQFNEKRRREGSLSKGAGAVPPLARARGHDPTTPEGIRAMWADVAQAMYEVAMDPRQDITARVAAAAQIRQAAGVGKEKPAPKQARLGMESLLGGAASDKASDGSDDATSRPVKTSAPKRAPIGENRSLSGPSTGGSGLSEGNAAHGSDPAVGVPSEPSKS